MNYFRPLTPFVLVLVSSLSGCVADQSAPPAAQMKRSTTDVDSRAGVLRHCDRLLARLNRMELQERRKQPTAPSAVHSVWSSLAAFREIIANPEVRANDSTYYRQIHVTLDTFSLQVDQIERLLAQLPVPSRR